MGRSAALQILVVDDNRDTADALAWLLQSRGHEARAAYDGPAALLAVERHSPDIVIQDLGLPGMNGYDIARRMRQLPAGRPAFLVAVTGRPQRGGLRMAAAIGFDLLLGKPLGLTALELLLEAARRRRRECDCSSVMFDSVQSGLTARARVRR
jgi:two-component system, chemotaxis family, CheB/CheR fusion protein